MKRGKKTTLLAGAVLLVVVGFAAYHYRAHLRFWWLFESLGPNAQGYAEYRHRQTGIVFVKLPGGTFLMGAQTEDPEARNWSRADKDSAALRIRFVKCGGQSA